MKKNKGITLVALVITIIILLILAGVALSMIAGGEGIFAKANEAATKYNQAAKNEVDTLNDLLSDNPDRVAKIEVGTLATEPSTINGEKGTYKNPIIPEGFKAINVGEAIWGSEQGWDKGLVIQDGIEGSETIGSEFVWVPVNLKLSDDIQAKIDNNEALTVREIQETWQRKAWEIGAWYNKSTRGELYPEFNEPFSNGYPGEEEDFVKMATSVLKNGGFYVGRYETGTETPRISTESENGTLVCKADVYPYNCIPFGQSFSEKNDDVKGAKELSQEMYTGRNGYGVKSSLIYGVQWDQIMEWIENERNVSNSTEWGNYSNRAYILPKGEEYCFSFYEGDSSLTTIGWTYTKEDLEKKSGEMYLLKTGAYAKTKTNNVENVNSIVKNIYDLAGNCYEWTMEAYDIYNRVFRGGDYGDDGDLSPAADRVDITPDFVHNVLGMRTALYI